jgi:hypothetical protein
MSAATPTGPSASIQSGQLVYRFDIPLFEVSSGPIRSFDAYWRGKMTGLRLPGRADIDPVDIKQILPDIVLLDVEWEPFRCRVRLRGTRAEQFRPRDVTTKYLDEGTTFEPGRREDYLAEMEFVATTRRPAFARDWIRTRFGSVREIFAGIWPLTTDGARIDKLIVIEDFAGLDAAEFDLT